MPTLTYIGIKMTQQNSFEQLIIEQSSKLMACEAKHFVSNWELVAQSALDWFDIDRMTLFPNSIIILNEGQTFSVSRQNIPQVDKEFYTSGDYQSYLTLLKRQKTWRVFKQDELRTNKVEALYKLYQEGGRWHCIIKLELFGKSWGTLAFSRFNEEKHFFDELYIKRLKALSDIWLCYWQHSTMCLNLNQDTSQVINEGEKLLLLSKKQRFVLALLAQGYTAKECAEKLFLSPRTIESHKYRMLDLLDFNNHTELIQFALRNGVGIDN
jgi:DNA-binding CsgD family transcriptional regulator